MIARCSPRDRFRILNKCDRPVFRSETPYLSEEFWQFSPTSILRGEHFGNRGDFVLCTHAYSSRFFSDFNDSCICAIQFNTIRLFPREPKTPPACRRSGGTLGAIYVCVITIRRPGGRNTSWRRQGRRGTIYGVPTRRDQCVFRASEMI